MIGCAGHPCPLAPCSQILQVQGRQRSPKVPGQAHCCLLTEEGVLRVTSDRGCWASE